MCCGKYLNDKENKHIHHYCMKCEKTKDNILCNDCNNRKTGIVCNFRYRLNALNTLIDNELGEDNDEDGEDVDDEE